MMKIRKVYRIENYRSTKEGLNTIDSELLYIILKWELIKIKLKKKKE